jgi:hypothetical protein
MHYNMRVIYTNSTKEGQNRGFDPYVKNISFKSSLAYHVSEPNLKVG